MFDDTRAFNAYTDVLAVEAAPHGVYRVVTLSDVYTLVPDEGLHQCPDREYNDVDVCKHVVATEVTRERFDAPEGWLVVENLDERVEPSFELETDSLTKGNATLDAFDSDESCWCDDEPMECFECFQSDRTGASA